MPRYRVQFSKEGPARFISHLDLVRTFERAIRRARLPIAFSQGFNPHPKFNFGAPLPVGVTGREEYLDIDLTEELPSQNLVQRLATSLPGGLSVSGAWLISDSTPALMSVVDRATYKIILELSEPVSQEKLMNRIEKFLSSTTITVTRKTKEGKEKVQDIRPGILDMAGQAEGNNAAMEVELRTGSISNVKPEELVKSFIKDSGLNVVPYGITIIRTGIYARGPEGRLPLSQVEQRK